MIKHPSQSVFLRYDRRKSILSLRGCDGFLPPKHVAQVIFFQRIINKVSLLFVWKVLSSLTSYIVHDCHPASFFTIWHGNKCIAVGQSGCSLTHTLRILKTASSIWG